MRPAGRVSRIHFLMVIVRFDVQKKGGYAVKDGQRFINMTHHRYPKDVSVWIGCEEDVSRVTKDQNA